MEDKKMKKLLTAAVVGVMAGFAFALEFEQPFDASSNYTVTNYEVSTKFGSTYRTPSSKEIYTFADGNLASAAEYTARDSLVETITYEYDENRRLTSAVKTDKDGKLLGKKTFGYEKDGRLKEIVCFNENSELSGKVINKYSAGKTEISYYDGEGALLNRDIEKFEGSKKIAVERYFADGSLKVKEEIEYKNEKVSAITSTDAEKKIVEKAIFKYDVNGKISEIQKVNKDGSIFNREIYKNNDSGMPVKISVYNVAEKFGAIANELASQVEVDWNEAAEK